MRPAIPGRRSSPSPHASPGRETASRSPRAIPGIRARCAAHSPRASTARRCRETGADPAGAMRLAAGLGPLPGSHRGARRALPAESVRELLQPVGRFRHLSYSRRLPPGPGAEVARAPPVALPPLLLAARKPARSPSRARQVRSRRAAALESALLLRQSGRRRGSLPVLERTCRIRRVRSRGLRPCPRSQRAPW